MKKGREEKTKFSKILLNNQIITACRIELRVQEMTVNEKLTMTGLISTLYNLINFFILILCQPLSCTKNSFRNTIQN